MTAVAEKQDFSFQTEIKQLLHLLSHSLYQHRDIALRELISNASDALNKLRHIQLTDEQFRDDQPLEIILEPNREQRVLTIRDNGIGLTRDELIENLGTIAHSGSLAFLNQLSGDAKQDLSLIGQFGVGFYSAFMLADKVEVLTRSYRDPQGYRWESDGTGRYSIEPADGVPRGAQIRLHLKVDLEDYLLPWKLKEIVRKYSSFVPHPIRLDGEQLNDQRPIWVEPKNQVTDDQYTGFYQYLTHHTDEKPLWQLHLSSDSPLQFHAILFCPPTNFENLGFGKIEHGLHLCAKRILVQDNCRELLPEYLRFLHGLVDSADLPLNVSRETLQDSTLLGKIRKVLTRRVLDHLANWADENPTAYAGFIAEFAPILRAGVSLDWEHREKVAKLLRFRSSAAGDELTSLDAYLKRMSDKQTQIYFLGGPELGALARSPNLEAFHKASFEVLFVTDPVDELVFSNLGTYAGKRIVSIDSADAELPPGTDDSTAESHSPPAGFNRVLELFQRALGDRVAEVRESKRLTDSPCCLVNPKGAVTPQLQKVLQMTQKDYQPAKRVLEVNPRASLIRRLSELAGNVDNAPFIEDCARQLLDNALLLEGHLPELQSSVSRMQQFMEELASKRSVIALA